jgi:hypothetical protein
MTIDLDKLEALARATSEYDCESVIGGGRTLSTAAVAYLAALSPDVVLELVRLARIGAPIDAESKRDEAKRPGPHDFKPYPSGAPHLEGVCCICGDYHRG